MPTDAQREAPRHRPDRSPVMTQRWSDLLFLHWEVPAEQISPTLPPGLHLETFQGKAYLGIVPFAMEKVRPRFLPPVPGLSWFLELNLRTYVYDEQGRPGVWFYSLDANQPIAVELARKLFHLPYQHAKMCAPKSDGLVNFQSLRKGTGQTARFPYQGIGPIETAAPGTLEFFLLERYLLFSTNRAGKLKIGQVHHSPYPFQQASCEEPSLLPFTWNNFPEPEGPPVSVLSSPGVNVEIFPLRDA